MRILFTIWIALQIAGGLSAMLSYNGEQRGGRRPAVRARDHRALPSVQREGPRLLREGVARPRRDRRCSRADCTASRTSASTPSTTRPPARARCGSRSRTTASAAAISTCTSAVRGAAGSPITLGHEFCGVVDQLGPGVSGVELGTRVAVRPFYKCGACARCASGPRAPLHPAEGARVRRGGRRARRVLRHGRRHGVRPARRRDARTGCARRADGGVVQRCAARRRRARHAHGRVRCGPDRRRRVARPAGQGRRRRRRRGAVGRAACDHRRAGRERSARSRPPTTYAAR